MVDWIDTRERKPEPYERVLLCRTGRLTDGMVVEQGYRKSNGWWKVYGADLRDASVPYWTPIPEPPCRLLEDDDVGVSYGDMMGFDGDY